MCIAYRARIASEWSAKVLKWTTESTVVKLCWHYWVTDTVKIERNRRRRSMKLTFCTLIGLQVRVKSLWREKKQPKRNLSVNYNVISGINCCRSSLCDLAIHRQLHTARLFLTLILLILKNGPGFESPSEKFAEMKRMAMTTVVKFNGRVKVWRKVPEST